MLVMLPQWKKFLNISLATTTENKHKQTDCNICLSIGTEVSFLINKKHVVIFYRTKEPKKAWPPDMVDISVVACLISLFIGLIGLFIPIKAKSHQNRSYFDEPRDYCNQGGK